MKAKHFLGMTIVTGAFSTALVGAGCGSSTNGTGATGTGGTSTTATTTSSVSSVVTGTGGGGMGGSGSGGAPSTDTSKASATTVSINGAAVNGNTGSATTVDWYTFTGTAGERVYIAANAVTIVNPAPADDETNILDTVITLYDSTGSKVLAQDDDGYPRQNTDSALFAELPTTGTYYYTVDSCGQAFGPACTGETPSEFIYETFAADVGKLNGTTEGSLKYSIQEFYAGTTQDGTTAKAVPITYTVSSNEITPLPAIDGDSFTAAANTQVFSFTVPAALKPATGARLRTDFWLQPVGTDNGDGSTGNVTAWVTDSTGTTIIGQCDQKNYKDGDDETDGPVDLSVPVTAGSQYYLFVQDDNAAPASTDYYFFLHSLGSGNPVQITGDGNTSAATAQMLATTTDQPDSYFVDGDLTALAPTEFWYEVDPPSGVKSVFASCSSLRSGSGVQGFTMDLQAQVGASGTPASILPSGTTGVETATADLSVPIQTATSGLSIPTGTTKMFLVVSGTSQSATVTGTSYQCAVSYE
jgi:hypothetical protein